MTDTKPKRPRGRPPLPADERERRRIAREAEFKKWSQEKTKTRRLSDRTVARRVEEVAAAYGYTVRELLDNLAEQANNVKEGES